MTPEVKTKFTEKLKNDPQQFCGQEVSAVVRKDGLKLVFRDGSRVYHRLSETEPVIRVYHEARSERGREKLVLRRRVGFFGRKPTLEVMRGEGRRISAFLYFFTSAFRRMAEQKV